MEPSLTRPQIAVLDDDASVLKALRRLLEATGYDVSTYRSGDELLSVITSTKPSCLILDVHLPGMTGLEVLKRARSGNASVCAIVITAFDAERERELACEPGAAAFFRKPFDNGSLLRAVAACLARPCTAGGSNA